MRLNKFSLFLVFFFLHSAASHSLIIIFMALLNQTGFITKKVNLTDYDKKFASNTYLNLKYNLSNKWVFDLQTESYLPKQLQNYSDLLKILLSQHSVLISIPIISILQQERYMSNLVVEYF